MMIQIDDAIGARLRRYEEKFSVPVETVANIILAKPSKQLLDPNDALGHDVAEIAKGALKIVLSGPESAPPPAADADGT